MVDYSRLPTHMQSAAKAYVEHGLHPGDFLTAVLSNNLVEAFGKADDINFKRMSDWAAWLYSDCPRGAWGSWDAVESWIAGCQSTSSTAEG